MKKVRVMFTDGRNIEGDMTKKDIDTLFNCLSMVDLKEEDKFITLNHSAFRASQIHSVYVEEVK